MSLTYFDRSINRFELKYIVRKSLTPEFLCMLDGYIYADPNCDGEAGYPIYSVYCDSPRFSLFWEKIEGIKFRRKLRFRRYGDTSDVFLEIKQRIGRTLQKRRVRWSLDQLVRTFYSRGLVDTAVDGHDSLVSEVFFFVAPLWVAALHGHCVSAASVFC